MPLDPDHEAKTALARKIATEVAKMRGEIATLREALERIADSGDGYTTGDGHARCQEIALAALAKAKQP
jgi:hypothetical protein